MRRLDRFFCGSVVSLDDIILMDLIFDAGNLNGIASKICMCVLCAFFFTYVLTTNREKGIEKS